MCLNMVISTTVQELSLLLLISLYPTRVVNETHSRLQGTRSEDKVGLIGFQLWVKLDTSQLFNRREPSK